MPRRHFVPPPGKAPVPILQEPGWAPGPVGRGGKSRPHTDSIPDRPARSQSLYRLSYTAHEVLTVMLVNTEVFTDVTPCLLVLPDVPKNIRNITVYQLTECKIPEDSNFRFLVMSIVTTSGSKM